MVLQICRFKTRFHYERGKDYSFFVLSIFFALLNARFKLRSIKETKNALLHARSGNRPFLMFRIKDCKLNIIKNK